MKTQKPMTFRFSTNVTLLFAPWDVSRPSGIILSSIIVLMLAVFYELLKVTRLWLASYGNVPDDCPLSNYAVPSTTQADSSTMLVNSASGVSVEPPAGNFWTRKRWLMNVIQTVLHTVQVTLGYMLMMCVMTYNTWIFLAIVTGSFLGFYLSCLLLSRQ